MPKTPEEMRRLILGEELAGVEELVELGEEAVPALLEILETSGDDAFVRHRALIVLGLVGSETAADAVEDHLASPEPVDRIHAARALAGILGAAAAPRLAALMEDPDLSVRKVAIQSLGAVGDLEALVVLRQVADGSPEDFLRDQAEKAMERIERREP